MSSINGYIMLKIDSIVTENKTNYRTNGYILDFIGNTTDKDIKELREKEYNIVNISDSKSKIDFSHYIQGGDYGSNLLEILCESDVDEIFYDINSREIRNQMKDIRIAVKDEEVIVLGNGNIEINDSIALFARSSASRINLASFRDNKINTAHMLFFNCNNLESIDISGLDTSKCKDTSYMFCGCKKLKTIDLSHNTFESVNEVKLMFKNCISLKRITGLKNAEFKSLTNMSKMFSDCNILSEIDLSNSDISKVRNMQEAFEYCRELRQLFLPYTATACLTLADRAFYKCNSLETLDLSMIKTDSLQNVTYMLAQNTKLVNLKLNKDFRLDKSKAKGVDKIAIGSFMEVIQELERHIN